MSLLTPWTPRFAGALDVNVKVFPSNVGNLAFDSVEHCSLMLLADYTAMSSGGGDVHAACVILFLPGGGSGKAGKESCPELQTNPAQRQHFSSL